METDSQTIPVPPTTGQVKYAGFWVRWAANFIDGLVLIIPNIIISFIVGALLVSTQKSDATSYIFINILGYVLGLGISWSYFVYMTNKYHATLGKRVFGLEVISDKPEGLSLGQVILRETIGKLISGIILLIGYIMVAFTARKQALHDKMASTLVIYKDPSKKVPVWAIVVIAILPAIVILGILFAVVLASLNTAREKAQDSLVKEATFGIISESITYWDKNNSLLGFVPSKQMPECSGTPIINITPDGQSMAVFAKFCSDKIKYFCAETPVSASVDVDETYAKSGKTTCLSTSQTTSQTQTGNQNNGYLADLEIIARAQKEAEIVLKQTGLELTVLSWFSPEGKKLEDSNTRIAYFKNKSSQLNVIVLVSATSGDIISTKIITEQNAKDSGSSLSDLNKLPTIPLTNIKISSVVALASVKEFMKSKGGLYNESTDSELTLVAEGTDNGASWNFSSKKAYVRIDAETGETTGKITP